MLELNICCDEACFWLLMLERYTAAVSQDAPEVMKFAAWGLVVWGAGEILQWWRSGNETNYFVRFRGSASIAWTHLNQYQFNMWKKYHQDGLWLTWAPVCSVNDWTPVVPVIYVCMNRCGVCHIWDNIINYYFIWLNFIFLNTVDEVNMSFQWCSTVFILWPC